MVVPQVNSHPSPESRGVDLDLNLEKGTCSSCRSSDHMGGRGAWKPPGGGSDTPLPCRHLGELWGTLGGWGRSVETSIIGFSQ